jgi:hypothetical protein
VGLYISTINFDIAQPIFHIHTISAISNKPFHKAYLSYSDNLYSIR